MNHRGLIILVVFVMAVFMVPAVQALDSEPTIGSPTVGKGPVTAPTSRFMNVEGILKEIQGNVYVLEENSEGESIRVEIGQDTAFPNGQKEPGQLIQALVTSINQHALIIR